jgi:hypothetical protein
MPFIARVNPIKVAPELLMAASLALAKMTKEYRRDLTARSIKIFKMLEANKISPNGGLLSAINLRLEALSHLQSQKHKELEAWSRPDDGKASAHEDLFKAAAIEPMVREGGRPAFEPVSFFKRLLSISKIHERA